MENGPFVTGEKLTNNGNYVNSPKIIGSLSDIDVTDAESGYSVGDIIDIIGTDGELGVARVTGVFDVSNRVDFNLLEGGYGYS
ncbi:MAG: hypothetical protein GWN40_12010, partial [Nitrosopumilaceae archaeon]|nr:hypothetical protein [Nitrosopumilaceae archaeon]